MYTKTKNHFCNGYTEVCIWELMMKQVLLMPNHNERLYVYL